ncbi:hypothetical protein CRYUN_Cryun15aG0008200 [Craigia yunnanensis]
MASMVLSSLCFPSQKPCSFTFSLRFSFGSPTGSRFGGPLSVGFGSVKKINGRLRLFWLMSWVISNVIMVYGLPSQIFSLLEPIVYLDLVGFIAQSLEEQLFRWLRAAELTCDRAALLVAQDPKLNVDAFLEQARSYDVQKCSNETTFTSSTVLRAREIDDWSRSHEYRSLLKRATQMSVVEKVYHCSGPGESQ